MPSPASDHLPTPTVLVIRAAGTNCEIEVCHGFELAGAKPELLHLDTLIREPARLDQADIIAFPGGFSYGDDIASGRIFAVKLREKLWPALAAAANRGVPMIGICNGFQMLVQCGLLPGPESAGVWGDQPPQQTLSLAQNIGGRYVCRWVPVAYEPNSVCLWTKDVQWTRGWCGHANDALDAIGVPDPSDINLLPVGHGEGRLTTLDATILPELERRGQVALRYLDNYNGSEGAVAGVCDASGRVFGLMPHPDRYLAWTRHPYWTRLPRELLGGTWGETPGLRMFRNAVEAVAGVTK